MRERERETDKRYIKKGKQRQRRGLLKGEKREEIKKQIKRGKERGDRKEPDEYRERMRRQRDVRVRIYQRNKLWK